jgi:hypothetical protein
MDIKVRCYSGHVYAEEPRSFVWQGRELRVKSIEQAWQEPGKRLFRVITDDGKPFELCYNEAGDRWCGKDLGGKEKTDCDESSWEVNQPWL